MTGKLMVGKVRSSLLGESFVVESPEELDFMLRHIAEVSPSHEALTCKKVCCLQSSPYLFEKLFSCWKHGATLPLHHDPPFFFLISMHHDPP